MGSKVTAEGQTDWLNQVVKQYGQSLKIQFTYIIVQRSASEWLASSFILSDRNCESEIAKINGIHQEQFHFRNRSVWQ